MIPEDAQLEVEEQHQETKAAEMAVLRTDLELAQAVADLLEGDSSWGSGWDYKTRSRLSRVHRGAGKVSRAGIEALEIFFRDLRKEWQ